MTCMGTRVEIMIQFVTHLALSQFSPRGATLVAMMTRQALVTVLPVATPHVLTNDRNGLALYFRFIQKAKLEKLDLSNVD